MPYARRRKSIKTTTFRKGIPNPIISYRSIYRKHLEALTPFQISNAEKCADQQPLGCWLLGDHFYAPPLLQPRYHLLVLVLFTQKQLSLSYTSITLTLSLECREQISCRLGGIGNHFLYHIPSSSTASYLKLHIYLYNSFSSCGQKYILSTSSLHTIVDIIRVRNR